MGQGVAEGASLGCATGSVVFGVKIKHESFAFKPCAADLADFRGWHGKGGRAGADVFFFRLGFFGAGLASFAEIGMSCSSVIAIGSSESPPPTLLFGLGRVREGAFSWISCRVIISNFAAMLTAKLLITIKLNPGGTPPS